MYGNASVLHAGCIFEAFTVVVCDILAQTSPGMQGRISGHTVPCITTTTTSALSSTTFSFAGRNSGRYSLVTSLLPGFLTPVCRGWMYQYTQFVCQRQDL